MELKLNRLSEVYSGCKKSHPSFKFMFPKFLSLRPKNYVVAGENGTCSVCVVLMRMLSWCLKDTNWLNWWQTRLFSSLHNHCCLAVMICIPPQQSCFFQECRECPGADKSQNLLQSLLEKSAIRHVNFKQWIFANISILETIVKWSDEFTHCKVSTVKLHTFDAVQQAVSLNKLKSDLQVGVVIVLCGFAQNYPFILQVHAVA
jgi:hypothetical protein